MKKLNLFSIFVNILFVAAMIMGTSCTKEGPAGQDGTNGADGADGADGTATCGQCHNFTETTTAKMVQYEASIHATGVNFERNGSSCAPCHVSKGFREVMETGLQETSATIENPTPVGCYTCHDIHQEYSTNDWALASVDPVTHWQGATIYDGGTGNLCANCHQSRVTDPFPDAGNPTGDYEVGSSRFGPHHGPQSNLLLGVGGYGGTSDASHAHFNADNNSCVGCHLATAYGNQAGGHNMAITYEYHGGDELLTAGCLGCHSDEAAMLENTEELYTDVDTLLVQLYDLLVIAGIANPESGLANTGTYSNDVAGAYYNYMYILEDRSKGLHNPTYTKQLLNNSIASLR